MILRSTSLKDVAGAVAAALRAIGYEPVVVGGSAATIHAPEVYRSSDVDMIVQAGISDPRAVVAAMAALGFSLRSSMFFHESNPYTVEFVPSPVSVANDIIEDFARIDTAFGPVLVLHAEDAVCDRLNKFVAWNDLDSLDVAVALARKCDVDLAKIAAFIERNGVGIDRDAYVAGHERFLRELARTQRTIPPFGFTTAVRVRFVKAPTWDAAYDVMTRIQAWLDEDRAAIAGLGAVDVGGVPAIETELVFFPLSLRTAQNVSSLDRMRIAMDSIAHLQAQLERFPELLEVVDEGAPPIATTGLR